MIVLLNDYLYDFQPLGTDAFCHRQFDLWRKPEFCVPIRTRNVNMHPIFLKRKEVEPVAFVSKHRWTHVITVAELSK